MATQKVTHHSEAFKDPFKKGLVTTLEQERTGWETDREPCEETLVVFLQHAAQFIVEGGYDDYEMRYISGLVMGWFSRVKHYHERQG